MINFARARKKLLCSNTNKFNAIYLGQKTINQARLSVPVPIRRSRRLNKNLPESPPRENVQPPIPKPPRVKRQLSLPRTTPQEANLELTPKIPSTVENFKKIYEDPENSHSFSGDAQSIANQIPSYRYVDRIERLARRLFI